MSKAKKSESFFTCWAFTTSIITPPFNIRARPALIVNTSDPELPLTGSEVAILLKGVLPRSFFSFSRLNQLLSVYRRLEEEEEEEEEKTKKEKRGELKWLELETDTQLFRT